MRETGRFDGLADRVMAGPPRLGATRFVVVDGPAGSGKTTFAGRLTRAFQAAGVRTEQIHIDDLLAGWTDLEGAWPRLYPQVLEPLIRGAAARYRPYDWVRERFGDTWVEVGVPEVLVVEGVSSARAAADPYRSLGVFVHADRDLRLARGLARDGEAMRAEWVRWMAEEDRHFATERTRARADVLVDGAPDGPNVLESEFVLLSRGG